MNSEDPKLSSSLIFKASLFWWFLPHIAIHWVIINTMKLKIGPSFTITKLMISTACRAYIIMKCYQNALKNNLKSFLRYGKAEHLDDANAFQNLFGSVICDQGKSNDLMRSFFSEVRCLEKRSPQHTNKM